MPKCRSCNYNVEFSYCPQCGERRFDNKHQSFFHLIKDLFESVTNVDGKIFNTLKQLAIKPGELSKSYMNGVKVKFLSPFQLFILLNITYFFVITITGYVVTFNTPLEIHLKASNFFHKDIAQALVNEHLALSNIGYELFSEKFNQKADILSKSLIFLVIPIFSIFVALLHFNHRQIATKSVVFSCHFFSFFLLFQIFYALVTWLLVTLGNTLLNTNILNSLSSELISSLTLFITLALYLILSLRHLFEEHHFSYIAKGLMLTLVVLFTLTLYRGLLFFITFNAVT